MRKLQEWDAQSVAEVIESRGETTIVVPREHLLKVAEYLATEPSLKFSFLSDIATVDRFPLEPRFEVNYQLLSIDLALRLRLKVKLCGQRPGDSVGYSRSGPPPTGTSARISIFSAFASRAIPICAAS